MRAHALYCVRRRESAAIVGGIDAAWSSEGEGRWITLVPRVQMLTRPASMQRTLNAGCELYAYDEWACICLYSHSRECSNECAWMNDVC